MVFKIKRLALPLAIVLLFCALCSCKKDDAEKTLGFTLESFISGFNEANTELEDIDASKLSEMEFEQDSLFVQYVFSESLHFCAYIEPKTREVQKMFMWLEPEGIADKTNSYKFAAYNAVMLSCFLDSEDEYSQVVNALSLDKDLEFNTDTLYYNDDFAAYYSYDGFGYRLLIVSPAEMEEIEAAAKADSVSSKPETVSQ